jgi:hydrogenase expression/formation protein HypE
MKQDKILLDHGAGGKMSHQLTMDILLPVFNSPILAGLDDGAVFDAGGKRLAFSTDTYTVDPIFFPGGNIGDLAINGTVNDIAMCGASPCYLSVGLILEEGFPIADLKTIVNQMGVSADAADVSIVTGDTKVVPKGAVDKIFINTSGVGVLSDGIDVACKNATPGDLVLLSGTIADHGVTILAKREGLRFDISVQSDSAPLNHLTRRMFESSRLIHVLRDPTRGGVATSLNEIAQASDVGIKLFEDNIPVKPEVRGMCELLGLDPLYLANEGKLLAFVAPQDAEAVLSVMQKDPVARDACIIGEVISDNPGRVFMQTRIGGKRIVDMLAGEQLPRIC